MAKLSKSSASKAKSRRKKLISSATLKTFEGNFSLQKRLDKKAGSAVVSVFVSAPASKSVAVNSAVTNQLFHDLRWPPNDITAAMNGPYRYTQNSMRNFLDGVSSTLAAGLPPYRFKWDSAFVNKALPLTVAALMAEIEMVTT